MSDGLMHPKNPERICWGCGLYCPSNDLRCRETRLPHPIEILGYDWDAPIAEDACAAGPNPAPTDQLVSITLTGAQA